MIQKMQMFQECFKIYMKTQNIIRMTAGQNSTALVNTQTRGVTFKPKATRGKT